MPVHPLGALAQLVDGPAALSWFRAGSGVEMVARRIAETAYEAASTRTATGRKNRTSEPAVTGPAEPTTWLICSRRAKASGRARSWDQARDIGLVGGDRQAGHGAEDEDERGEDRDGEPAGEREDPDGAEDRHPGEVGADEEGLRHGPLGHDTGEQPGRRYGAHWAARTMPMACSSALRVSMRRNWIASVEMTVPRLRDGVGGEEPPEAPAQGAGGALGPWGQWLGSCCPWRASGERFPTFWCRFRSPDG